MSSKPKIIAVVGPTASGKTTLSIKLAKEFAGEIISADSRQIYRGLDIGTGKVTAVEMDDVPHHLLDIVDPLTVYTGADFKRDATTAITDIYQRQHVPIIAGGTYFYLQLLRNKITSAPVAPNEALRTSLEPFSNAELFKKLQAADLSRANTIDSNNRRRLIRALEIIDQLGHVPEPSPTESAYDWLIIGVEANKETLQTNFAQRLDNWLAAGFQAEVEGLLAAGVPRARFQEFGFEYTLMLDYINREISLSELKEKFIQKNWQYAKRQMTWLKRDDAIAWYPPENHAVIFRRVTDFLQQQPS